MLFTLNELVLLFLVANYQFTIEKGFTAIEVDSLSILIICLV